MPWRKPWVNHPNAGIPANFSSKRRYTGINTLILMGASLANNYQSRNWGSSNAILSKIGAHVSKGQKATFVTFFKMLPKKGENGSIEKDNKGNDRFIPLLRQYPIFNIEQCQAPSVETLLDGRGSFSIVKSLLGQYDRKNRTQVTTLAELRQIAAKYLLSKDQPSAEDSRETIAEMINQGIQKNLHSYRADITVEGNVEPDFEPAEILLSACGANIRFGGDAAFYSPIGDFIQIPNKTSFLSLVDFYQTAFHEVAHWTKSENRVGRILSFEDQNQGYAFEELVAEISACFTLMELGVPLAESILPKSQSYIAHWLTTMENDPKFIFSAATQASKVVDFLLEFVGKQNPKSEEVEETEDQEKSVA
jgi:hypothetical protein